MNRKLLFIFGLTGIIWLPTISEAAECAVTTRDVSHNWVSFNDKPHHTFRFITEFSGTDCLPNGCRGTFDLQVAFHHPDDMTSGSQHVGGLFTVKAGESIGEVLVDHHVGFKDPVIIDDVTLQKVRCSTG